MAREHSKNASHCGVLAMRDSLYRRFFLEPHQPFHRRYEALRAVFVDGQPQVEVAQPLRCRSYTSGALKSSRNAFTSRLMVREVRPVLTARAWIDGQRPELISS